jgi:nucleoid DNA-binding protein
MSARKVVTATLAQAIASNLGLKDAVVRRVLDELDVVVERALVQGYEVEVGTLGYLFLRDPENRPTKLLGEVVRGRRVAFREKDANRHRWK